jgi:hypothetical protein
MFHLFLLFFSIVRPNQQNEKLDLKKKSGAEWNPTTAARTKPTKKADHPTSATTYVFFFRISSSSGEVLTESEISYKSNNDETEQIINTYHCRAQPSTNGEMNETCTCYSLKTKLVLPVEDRIER